MKIEEIESLFSLFVPALCFAVVITLYVWAHGQGERIKKSNPCSPEDCILSPVSSVDVIAGQAVELKLELRNFKKEPVVMNSDFNTQEISLKINDKNRINNLYHQEKTSFKVRESQIKSDACLYLQWIPLVSGKRSFDVLIKGKRVGNKSFEISVKSGSLWTLVETYETDETRRRSCYADQNQTISVIGFDKDGNMLSFLDPHQWSLQSRAYGEEMHDFCDLDHKKVFSQDGRVIQFRFTFSEAGVHYVRLKNNRDGFIKIPEVYTYKVFPNPSDDNNEDVPRLEYGKLKIKLMEGVSWSKVIGDDGVNMENINRVLNSVSRLSFADFTVIDQELNADISPGGFNSSQIDKIEELLCILFKGLYYRKKSSKLNEEREEWKGKAMNAYKENMHHEIPAYKANKEQCGREMDDSNHKASNALFQFYNYDRSEQEIDLHGQLVADDHKLELYREQLLKRNSKQHTKKIVESEREKMDEALRHLERRAVTESRENRDWLEIIVGAGHHSEDKRQKIRPKVETFLDRRHVEFQECNKGSLLVTYKEYSGPEPCFANFYCKTCEKPWGSSASWKGYWQMCYRCDGNGKESKCYPLKMRSKCSSQRHGNHKKKMHVTREDHRRLCQKCQDTNMDCLL